MTSPIPQKTDFSLDILGRYSCNGFDEAMLSTQRTNRPDGIDRPDARPFDVIIVGGGSFARRSRSASLRPGCSARTPNPSARGRPPGAARACAEPASNGTRRARPRSRSTLECYAPKSGDSLGGLMFRKAFPGSLTALGAALYFSAAGRRAYSPQNWRVHRGRAPLFPN